MADSKADRAFNLAQSALVLGIINAVVGVSVIGVAWFYPRPTSFFDRRRRGRR